ncbi:MAG: hypothetical protein KAT77_02800 [Nanoarchaeota archaeon]|nr:hypothetical protein [Nanoarchaeota archaeon]
MAKKEIKKEIKEAEKKEKKELKYLMRDFYELKHLLSLAREGKEMFEKGELKRLETIQPHLRKTLRGGFFSGEERVEYRMARNYKQMKEALVVVETVLPKKDVSKINNLLKDTDVFDADLKKLGSRKGTIEKAVDDVKKKPEAIKRVVSLIEGAIKDVRAFEERISELIEATDKILHGKDIKMIEGMGEAGDFEAKAKSIKKVLNKAKIRLYYHTDMDGTVAALLIKLFSGAEIVEFVPCPFQNFPRKEPLKDSFDVFVDCRPKEQGKDIIRIDHHFAGESKEYLAVPSILVDTRFESAVTLVAIVFGLSFEEVFLRTMDKSDSGRKNAFSGFKFKDDTLNRVLNEITAEDLKDFAIFRDKVISFMEKGFAVEKVEDKSKKEQELGVKYGLVIENIKKTPRSPLTKIFHTPTHEGFFAKKIFKMTPGDFFGNINNYVKENYSETSGKTGIATYLAVGYYNKKLRSGEDHPEPYELFVSRSQYNANLNIGEIIERAKIIAKISNGGGRPGVGGINAGAISIIEDQVAMERFGKHYVYLKLREKITKEEQKELQEEAQKRFEVASKRKIANYDQQAKEKAIVALNYIVTTIRNNSR